MSKLCKPRRLWRPAVATHPRTTSRLSMSCGAPGTKLHITVPRSGTYSWNPLQAAKQRRCGYVRHLHLNIVPRRGTDTSPMMLRMIVGPALRNQERVRWCLSHSCAPSELAVGFWWIRVPSGHGADWRLLWEGAWRESKLIRREEKANRRR